MSFAVGFSDVMSIQFCDSVVVWFFGLVIFRNYCVVATRPCAPPLLWGGGGAPVYATLGLRCFVAGIRSRRRPTTNLNKPNQCFWCLVFLRIFNFGFLGAVSSFDRLNSLRASMLDTSMDLLHLQFLDFQ